MKRESSWIWTALVGAALILTACGGESISVTRDFAALSTQERDAAFGGSGCSIRGDFFQLEDLLDTTGAVNRAWVLVDARDISPDITESSSLQVRGHEVSAMVAVDPETVTISPEFAAVVGRSAGSEVAVALLLSPNRDGDRRVRAVAAVADGEVSFAGACGTELYTNTLRGYRDAYMPGATDLEAMQSLITSESARSDLTSFREGSVQWDDLPVESRVVAPGVVPAELAADLQLTTLEVDVPGTLQDSGAGLCPFVVSLGWGQECAWLLSDLMDYPAGFVFDVWAPEGARIELRLLERPESGADWVIAASSHPVEVGATNRIRIAEAVTTPGHWETSHDR